MGCAGGGVGGVGAASSLKRGARVLSGGRAGEAGARPPCSSFLYTCWWCVCVCESVAPSAGKSRAGLATAPRASCPAEGIEEVEEEGGSGALPRLAAVGRALPRQEGGRGKRGCTHRGTGQGKGGDRIDISSSSPGVGMCSPERRERETDGAERKGAGDVQRSGGKRRARPPPLSSLCGPPAASALCREGESGAGEERGGEGKHTRRAVCRAQQEGEKGGGQGGPKQSSLEHGWRGRCREKERRPKKGGTQERITRGGGIGQQTRGKGARRPRGSKRATRGGSTGPRPRAPLHTCIPPGASLRRLQTEAGGGGTQRPQSAQCPHAHAARLTALP